MIKRKEFFVDNKDFYNEMLKRWKVNPETIIINEKLFKCERRLKKLGIDYKTDPKAKKILKKINLKIQESLKDVPVSDKIGVYIYNIANNVAYKSNFYNWKIYHDDMTGDAILNCMKRINSFNPFKSNNPFSYYTSVVSWEYIKRISIERKQTYIHYKTISGAIEKLNDDFNKNVIDNTNLYYDKMKDYIERYENKNNLTAKEKKKKKKNSNNLEQFFDKGEL